MAMAELPTRPLFLGWKLAPPSSERTIPALVATKSCPPAKAKPRTFACGLAGRACQVAPRSMDL
jgi:hypothetical protein